VDSAPPEEPGVNLERYQDSPVEELYSAGVELFSLWHVREATALFERAAETDSSFYRAWVRLVECYAHPLVGSEDGAKSALKMASAVRLSDSDTTFLAGMEQLFIVRDYAAAAAQLTRAEQTEVSHEDATYYNALALFLSGRVEESRLKVEELLQRDETVGRFVELSVRCAMAAGDAGAGERQARELARMYAEEPYPYVLLAMVEQSSGRQQSAVEFCNNALVLDSKYIPAILARANLYAAAGMFEAARVSFEKLLMFDDPALRALGYEGIGFVDLLSGRFNNGVDEMDEAVRSGILAGAVRQGLSVATQLVGYLCELGQGDAATAAVDRWVTGFGDIPVSLGSVRIYILEGEREQANKVLMSMQSSKEWAEWIGMMSIDYTEMVALAHISVEEYDAALAMLSRDPGTGARRPGARLFLAGYAAFQSGSAEEAATAFAAVGDRLFGVEFPYHGDPVRYVRSLFYLAETSIASGDETAALAHYERFLDYWGEADWDVQAVTRAREKLESLTTSTTP